MIAGVGRYLPERIVTNRELETEFGLPDGWIARFTGVHQRRRVTGETSSYMGAQAAREAMDDAGATLADIDLILNASGTPEQSIPDTGALIQRQLGARAAGIPAMSMHATCMSFLVALDMSAALIAAKRYRTILIVSTEVSSAALNVREPENFTLFGDAAAAAVVTAPPLPWHGDSAAPAIHRIRFETYGEGADLTALPGGGTRLHPANPAHRPADNLFHMDGPGVLRLTLQYAASFLERLQPGLSCGLQGIDLVIPHQASKMGMKMLGAFGWPEAKIVRTLDLLGNCIAASIPATLYEAVRQERLCRGDTALLVGTGAGISLGGVILTY
jgi:3-oxoacyl-[acyl-carrier-protein] synthase-3